MPNFFAFSNLCSTSPYFLPFYPAYLLFSRSMRILSLFPLLLSDLMSLFRPSLCSFLPLYFNFAPLPLRYLLLIRSREICFPFNSPLMFNPSPFLPFLPTFPNFTQNIPFLDPAILPFNETPQLYPPLLSLHFPPFPISHLYFFLSSLWLSQPHSTFPFSTFMFFPQFFPFPSSPYFFLYVFSRFLLLPIYIYVCVCVSISFPLPIQ